MNLWVKYNKQKPQIGEPIFISNMIFSSQFPFYYENIVVYMGNDVFMYVSDGFVVWKNTNAWPIIFWHPVNFKLKISM